MSLLFEDVLALSNGKGSSMNSHGLTLAAFRVVLMNNQRGNESRAVQTVVPGYLCSSSPPSSCGTVCKSYCRSKNTLWTPKRKPKGMVSSVNFPRPPNGPTSKKPSHMAAFWLKLSSSFDHVDHAEEAGSVEPGPTEA